MPDTQALSEATLAVSDAPGSHSDTVIVIRTHYFDDQLGDLARSLRSTGCTLCIAVDETSGPVEIDADLVKLEITPAAIDGLGLLTTYDMAWRCGDYAFYLARERFPSASFYWVVEPDVRANFGRLADFFAGFADHTDIDLLAASFEPAAEGWPWRPVMAPFATNIYRCFFPVVRLSGSAIDALLPRRRRLSQLFRPGADGSPAIHDPEFWPNDESFTASELMRLGLRCHDLNFPGGIVYDPVTFNFDFPISARRFATFPPDDRLYHPVLHGERFLRKVRGMFEHLRAHDVPQQQIAALFGRPELLDDIRWECGDAEAVRFGEDYAAAVKPADAVQTRQPRPETVRNGLLQKIRRGHDPFEAFPTAIFESDVQGWNSSHPYLHEAIRELRPRTIVEVGVWKGAATLGMAAELERLGLDAAIIAVDTWLGGADHWVSQEWFPQLGTMHGYPLLYQKFIGNVLRSGLADFVVPLRLDSLNAAELLRRRDVFPDIIHLDGGRDYVAVMADLVVWWPILAPGGWLIGDDYQPGGAWPGVKRAFDEFFADFGLAPIEFTGGKCRIRKPLELSAAPG